MKISLQRAKDKSQIDSANADQWLGTKYEILLPNMMRTFELKNLYNQQAKRDSKSSPPKRETENL